MDLTLVCQDCHNEFIWTQDNQNYYAAKKLDQPKFCLICRGKHRAMQRDPGHEAKKMID